MANQRDRAAVIAPPPLLAVVAIGAGLIADRFWPIALTSGAGALRVVAATVVFLIAGAFIFSGIRQLMKHKEHPSPYKPTEAIVSEGVYRFTRNPIYVGFVVAVIATAIAANTAWVLISAVALFVALHFGVVRAEEEYLSAKFGDAYNDYCRRVRRWIWRGAMSR